MKTTVLRFENPKERQMTKPGPKPGQRRTESLTGQIFGLWKILDDDSRYDKVYPAKPPRKFDQRVRRVLAQCGGCDGVEVVIWQSLIENKSLSCRGCSNESAGLKRRKPYHDLVLSATYNSWSNMKQRCLNPKNPNFERYGGKGIGIDKRWMKFGNFLEDMGEAPEGMTIDRIEGMEGYHKANCRWATRQEQAANRDSWADKSGRRFVGVYKHQDCNKFVAMFRDEYLGLYDTDEEAARVRDRAAREYYGDGFIFYLNFPSREEADESIKSL
jgi:hypothetical protein